MMHSKMVRMLALALITACSVLLIGLPVMGLPETNIGLLRFEAFPTDTGVRLEWDVETEVGTAGYKIKRGENGSFAYLANPQGGGDLFVLAEGGPALSASYTVDDESAVNGSTYVYQLVEVTTNSGEVVQAELTLDVVVVPTNTPVTFSGGGNGGGSGGGGGNANSATATITATPTARTTTGPTNTPPPTRAAPTPLPTVTVPPALSAAPPAVPPATSEVVRDSVSSSPAEVPVETETESFELDGLVAVAEAQEEQTSAAGSYPGALPPVEQEGAIETIVDPEFSEATPEIGLERDLPVVIGVGASADDTQLSAPDEETAAVQETGSGGSGRLLLWLAFIAAMAIFIAAVIGAIILYSRQRTTE